MRFVRLLAALAITTTASAQAPLLRPKPIFAPGLYETESRNSAFRAEDVRREQCLASADYDAFRRETMARYAASPQFKAVCRLSAAQAIADGFALAMDCTGARTIIAFHFAKNLVASTTRTRIDVRPE